MPTVWMRVHEKHRNRFHRSPDCRQLRKRVSYGDPHQLIAVDLEEVFVRPCRTCYPDAPKIVVFKAYCVICEARFPCEHNGAVRITRRHGEPYWVWPDTNQMPLFRKSA